MYQYYVCLYQRKLFYYCIKIVMTGSFIYLVFIHFYTKNPPLVGDNKYVEEISMFLEMLWSE